MIALIWAIGGFFILAGFEMNTMIEVQLDSRWGQLENTISKAVELAARNVEKGGKERIAAWPAVDTGATMNSIMAKPEGGFSDLAWKIGPSTEYSAFIEFGTVRMRARAFMVPALEDERPRLIDALTQLLKKLK